MNGEIEPTDSPDQITDKIYDVIRTMNGERGVDSHSFRFTAAPDEYSGPNNATGVDPDELNSRLEGQLFDQGIFSKVSSNQRRLLGCVACRLKGSTADGEPAELRTTEIALCTGLTYDPARKLLDSLRDAGLLHGEVKQITGRGVNAPTQWFSLTERAHESGFADAITAPEECGLTDEARRRGKQPVRPRTIVGKLTNDKTNHTAEGFLIDRRVFQNRSASRRAVLGCLACQLNKGADGVFGMQVARCQGITHTTAGLIFSGLESREIVTRTYGEAQRVLYRLSIKSPLGRGLDRLLEVPPQCGLERTMEPESKK